MQHDVRGLTLIELMIVVAIVGILATIALPPYRLTALPGYMAKSQLADIAGGRSAYESLVVTENLSSVSLADIGLALDTPRCAIGKNYDSNDGSGDISCVVKGSPIVRGKTIQLVRTSSGACRCQVDASIASVYHPNGCAH